MIIVEAGHIYDLDWLGGTPPSKENRLVFVNREPGTGHAGTQTQEVLRALIDRTMHCDNCLRWPGNDQIIHHLRAALVLHEARALERKVQKNHLQNVELWPTGPDGHFMINKKYISSSPDHVQYNDARYDEEWGSS